MSYRLYLMICGCLPSLILCSLALFGQEVSPWLGNVYEFQAKVAYEHQGGGRIDGRNHLSCETAKASLSFMPHPDWSTELEFFGSRTTDHTVGFDSAKLIARYSLLNDIVGDFVSATGGLSVAQNSSRFVNDLMLMHHRQHEAEMHLAVGKEFERSKTSYFHAWMAAFYGIANHSSPWIRTELHLDTVTNDTHLVDLFLQTDKGLGNHRLHSADHFHGYSHVHYSLVDLGLTYKYSVIGYGSAFGTIKKRLYARSCPKEVVSIEIGLILPFSF